MFPALSSAVLSCHLWSFPTKPHFPRSGFAGIIFDKKIWFFSQFLKSITNFAMCSFHLFQFYFVLFLQSAILNGSIFVVLRITKTMRFFSQFFVSIKFGIYSFSYYVWFCIDYFYYVIFFSWWLLQNILEVKISSPYHLIFYTKLFWFF